MTDEKDQNEIDPRSNNPISMNPTNPASLALIQNNLRIKSELEIVAKALDNSLRKIKIYQQRFREPEKRDQEVQGSFYYFSSQN